MGWAEKECGNGCLESRGSRDCCNRFCLQTWAAHLEKAGRRSEVSAGRAQGTQTCLPAGGGLQLPQPPVSSRQDGTDTHRVLEPKLRSKAASQQLQRKEFFIVWMTAKVPQPDISTHEELQTKGTERNPLSSLGFGSVFTALFCIIK